MTADETDPQSVIVPVRGVALDQDEATGEYLCHYVGFGSRPGVLRTREVTFLGFGFTPSRRRGVLRDIAFGYVSGFPVGAILWYVLTRSLPPKSLQQRIQRWEARTGRYDGTIREMQLGAPVELYDLIQAGVQR
ncbi:hypothetical protein NY057_05165 [Curtobacterium flaccumfaciens]|uniref:hypothetical protein n=1 Tax=Curtobacterium flaccumfaciens TaxID=2035 RepID=UPI0022076FE7|nr:hypothetical protein [Curtobacterium flaccumfaciens]UWD83636.1 hypothetical protein NY057_05165 [Curtobacterium flaccumfaciens]